MILFLSYFLDYFHLQFSSHNNSKLKLEFFQWSFSTKTITNKQVHFKQLPSHLGTTNNSSDKWGIFGKFTLYLIHDIKNVEKNVELIFSIPTKMLKSQVSNNFSNFYRGRQLFLLHQHYSRVFNGQKRTKQRPPHTPEDRCFPGLGLRFGQKKGEMPNICTCPCSQRECFMLLAPKSELEKECLKVEPRHYWNGGWEGKCLTSSNFLEGYGLWSPLRPLK